MATDWKISNENEIATEAISLHSQCFRVSAHLLWKWNDVVWFASNRVGTNGHFTPSAPFLFHLQPIIPWWHPLAYKEDSIERVRLTIFDKSSCFITCTLGWLHFFMIILLSVCISACSSTFNLCFHVVSTCHMNNYASLHQAIFIKYYHKRYILSSGILKIL